LKGKGKKIVNEVKWRNNDVPLCGTKVCECVTRIDVDLKESTGGSC